MPEPNVAVVGHIKTLVNGLVMANVAIPTIVSAISTTIQIVKALQGNAPPMAELLRHLEAELQANRERGLRELERLRTLL